jgi:hypothetical protein
MRVNVSTSLSLVTAEGTPFPTGGYNSVTTRRRMNQYLIEWGFPQRVSKSSFAYTATLIMEKP